MTGPVTFKIEGLSEMDAALGSLMDDFDASKATVKNVMRRGAMDALVPMADLAESLAPKLTGHMADTITEGTRLTSRQSRLNKKRDDKSTVNVFMGPNDPAAVQQEFGNANDPPQPFMRPAFAAEAQNTIMRVASSLKAQLNKAIPRARAKALKKAAG